MRTIHLSLGTPRPGEETAYQYNLMLLRLQEAAAWRLGHVEGETCDRLGLCLRAYAETLWRGNLERHPFIRA